MKDYTEETTWIDPELDFEDLYRDGQYEDIVRLSDENINLMISLYQRSETVKLKKSLDFGMIMLSYFERSLQKSPDVNSIFWGGKLKGYLETLDKLQFVSDQNQLAVERARLLGTKHLDEIILILEAHGAMSQSELCESLGLQPSTLSEVLKKIRKTQLVYVRPYGKYKVYSLTAEGARYGALLRKKLRPQTEMETAIRVVQSYLQNHDTRKRFLNMLNDKLSETSCFIVSMDNQSTFIDSKKKLNAMVHVDQVLREIVYSETELTAPMATFAGSTAASNYYQMNEDDFQNRKVNTLLGKQEKLLKIIKEAQGNSLDIYYTLFEEYLKDDENPSELLRLIMEFPNEIGDDDGASKKISQQVENETIHQYKSYLFDTVKLLTKLNDTVKEFYEKLWYTVFSSPTSPKDSEQCAVMLKFLSEEIPMLPYYQAVDEILMENDEFSKRVHSLSPRIQEAIHMFNRHFLQKTVESSQIVRLSEDLSKEDACVYWASIMTIIKKSAYYAGKYSALPNKDSETFEGEET